MFGLVHAMLNVFAELPMHTRQINIKSLVKFVDLQQTALNFKKTKKILNLIYYTLFTVPENWLC